MHAEAQRPARTTATILKEAQQAPHRGAVAYKEAAAAVTGVPTCSGSCYQSNDPCAGATDTAPTSRTAVACQVACSAKHAFSAFVEHRVQDLPSRWRWLGTAPR
ncbi:hypothetical protein TGPRC2_289370 [Toxoplasma gondii TgCatPRC2]|uniref:Uncharacterized protein n=14 Tax=Toxoplasma gondii TaxID=5811 RepID=B9PTQ5_TOXGV|nr:hypothetical protein TGME49_289370 [Toxoplasma gondii ME49]EPR59981.1 hypothetical protein TGGT1_289370 [Toxoplasma gondii GT1]ESS33717.1 hypothetical protein TGVEG_289370 [Toxoplasma gondii VEG]KAF4644428.1 hypothetical protein TGRH88_014220 [Toxoplasma gondii]KFG33206.1 hypothetical protein TGP89_289370 [Toxoplasma gondii p89]KFG42609.1 hypothetical protein TGDOM2_289370 [Toxoplasma gondii GAB2-2007-GAL-DOM2]KFG53306.1 hypothetical protein TGFOU_289370 [Toxoplasma gondii FOU]KFG62678.1 |eukprot:XP_002368372.1 hypothetical protein TGME49_289370 [Toxoplasma gondii ME49]